MLALLLDSNWVIPAQDLELKFVKSSGPGGQNVNKLATKAELRLKLAQTTALLASQKQRLVATFPSHSTLEGDFVLTGDRFRSQQRNQEDVLERLASMLRSVRFPPKRRLKTKPSKASKVRRLSNKRHRSDLKRGRKDTPT